MRARMENLYSILQIHSWATQDDIARKFRELVRIYHPDMNAEPHARESFFRLVQAYNILSDPSQRAKYDQGPYLFDGQVAQVAPKANSRITCTVSRFRTMLSYSMSSSKRRNYKKLDVTLPSPERALHPIHIILLAILLGIVGVSLWLQG
jgi:DnaJ-class molecular chaperone